jgi:hypothetical protein
LAVKHPVANHRFTVTKCLSRHHLHPLITSQTERSAFLISPHSVVRTLFDGSFWSIKSQKQQQRPRQARRQAE